MDPIWGEFGGGKPNWASVTRHDDDEGGKDQKKGGFPCPSLTPRFVSKSGCK